MRYLIAHCPMLACNQTNLVCKLPTESIPEFEPNVYIALKCTNCGQVFREAVEQLEVRYSPETVDQLRNETR